MSVKRRTGTSCGPAKRAKNKIEDDVEDLAVQTPLLVGSGSDQSNVCATNANLGRAPGFRPIGSEETFWLPWFLESDFPGQKGTSTKHLSHHALATMMLITSQSTHPCSIGDVP
jgi:hypothetical protein